MKKFIILTIALMAFGFANAKVIRISYSDGSQKVYTSSEVSSIVFNNNGTLTVYAYDGTLLPQPAGRMYESVTVDDQEAITDVVGRRLTAELSGVSLMQRNVTAVNFVYPSVDPRNNSISLSGTILIPNEIFNGEVESEGVVLMHHYSVMSKDQVPTRGEFDASINYLLCNPVNLNYIVVMSDFYGFGATERFPQAYLFGEANARASLDALLAARRIMRNEGIDYGNLTFNVGTSSGGFEAMEALRVIQTHTGYESIYFDKTFAYGGPYDIKEVFLKYIEMDTLYYSVAPILTLISYNENGDMGLDYNSVFTPLIANHIQDWFLDKNYRSVNVLSFIGRNRPLSEILQPSYLNVNSPQSNEILNALASHSVNAPGWTPDTMHRIFLMHSHGDEYVPFVAARKMLDYLTSYGYHKSIIPGRTNLQTNMVLTNGHVEAGAAFMIQTIAALKAWPLMYTDGVLNPYYDSLAHADLDIVAYMRQLDAMGYDCRGFIEDVMHAINGSDSTSEVDYFSLIMQLGEAGVDVALLFEMLDDSGIDGIQFLIDLIVYLSENNENDSEEVIDAVIDRMLDVVNDPHAIPTQRYAKILMQDFDSVN